ncbi:PIN domain-containing protein [Pyronema domesticum]|nr:PIN domain-containing protein [Pyronema domesticum]
MPWNVLVSSLNVMQAAYACKGGVTSRIMSDGIMEPENGVCTLPEEYELRGMDWAQEYFESYGFFKTEKAKKDEETRIVECELMEKVRLERILWLAVRLSKIKDTILYDTQAEKFSVSPGLKARAHKNPEPKNTVEEGYVMVGRNLESEFGYQSSASKDNIADASSQVRELKEKEAILLHLETFNLITSHNWPVIIPNSVITELDGLRNQTGSVGDSAKSARITINRMITEGKDVRILTLSNADVTKAPGYKEKLPQNEHFDIKNLDDVIIQTAKAQASSRRQMFAEQGKPLNGAEPIILLTEDNNMRLKACALEIPTISTTALKTHLAALAGQEENKTSPGPKRTKITHGTLESHNSDIITNEQISGGGQQTA